MNEFFVDVCLLTLHCTCTSVCNHARSLIVRQCLGLGYPAGCHKCLLFARAVQMARALGEEEGTDATARRFYRRNSICEAPSATPVPSEQTLLSVSRVSASPRRRCSNAGVVSAVIFSAGVVSTILESRYLFAALLDLTGVAACLVLRWVLHALYYSKW